VGQPLVLHIERFGDSRFLSLVQTLEGVEIREELQASDVTAAEDDNKRFLPADA